MINRFMELLAEKQKTATRPIKVIDIQRATGVSRNTILNWMSGGDFDSLDTKVVMAFCDYFGCDIGDLLHYERDVNQIQ